MVDADGRAGKGPGNLIEAVKSSRHVNFGSTWLGPVMLGITSLGLLCVTWDTEMQPSPTEVLALCSLGTVGSWCEIEQELLGDSR